MVSCYLGSNPSFPLWSIELFMTWPLRVWLYSALSVLSMRSAPSKPLICFTLFSCPGILPTTPSSPGHSLQTSRKTCLYAFSLPSCSEHPTSATQMLFLVKLLKGTSMHVFMRLLTYCLPANTVYDHTVLSLGKSTSFLNGALLSVLPAHWEP